MSSRRSRHAPSWTERLTGWLTRRTSATAVTGAEHPPRTRVCVLNSLIDMPTSYGTAPYEGGTDATLYLLDYNYIDPIKTAACLSRLAEVRSRRHLDFSSKTLLLAAKGLHPAGGGLLELAREFRAHHVFFELWNGLKELVQLGNAAIDNLYFFPVATRLRQESATRVPSRPNRRVFVSLGGDDDLDLVRQVISRSPDLHFCVPSVSWIKPGSEKRFFDVQIPAANVSSVDCSAVRHDQQLSFSAAYRRAYDSCDTVLIATVPDKMFQMRGGVRLADALYARRHIVVTENPLCQVLMAQHERTGLVTEHAPESVVECLRRICNGGFDVDERAYEELRQLTVEESKLPWIIHAAENPEAARRSVFARGRDVLGATRRLLFARGRDLLESEVQTVARENARAR